ncbi:MAG: hypothetical protein AAB568_02120 [Patescibacteria group bacterium]
MAKKTKSLKRMEKKAEEQRAILERLLPQGRQPSTIGWRRAFHPHSRLEILLTKNTVSATLPDEL